MSRFVLALLAILFSTELLANRIDSLKTDNDVVAFLKSIEENFRSDKYEAIQLKTTETIRQDLNCNGIANQWHIKNWEKADFNHDGLTDIVIILYWYDYGVYVVIDNGNNNFKLKNLSYNIHEKCKLAKPVVISDQPLLLYTENKKVDTLIYKYDGFIELSKHPSNYKIDSIEFRTGYCYGSCPVFSIKIDRNRNAVYEAGTYNPKQGKFSATLEYDKSQAIFELLNYLSIRNLNDSYNVSWTDDQTAWLRIRFSDGTVKEIRDYGLKGTFGLRLLYSIFFDLRSTQDWK